MLPAQMSIHQKPQCIKEEGEQIKEQIKRSSKLLHGDTRAPTEKSQKRGSKHSSMHTGAEAQGKRTEYSFKGTPLLTAAKM